MYRPELVLATIHTWDLLEPIITKLVAVMEKFDGGPHDPAMLRRMAIGKLLEHLAAEAAADQLTIGDPHE